MRQYGFLERAARPDRRRRAAPQDRRRRDPAAGHASDAPARARRDRAAARAPRLAAAGRQRAATRSRSSARSASAACSPRRRGRRRCSSAEIVDVMEPPFPAVAADGSGARGGRAAGRRPAGAARHRRRPRGRHRHARRPAGSIGRVKFAHQGRSRRADARPVVRVGHPRDPPDLDVRAAGARRVRRGLRLLALGQPDARRARDGARRARGRPWRRVLLGPGGRARGDHRRPAAPARTSSCPPTSTAAPTASSTRC